MRDDGFGKGYFLGMMLTSIVWVGMWFGADSQKEKIGTLGQACWHKKVCDPGLECREIEGIGSRCLKAEDRCRE